MKYIARVAGAGLLSVLLAACGSEKANSVNLPRLALDTLKNTAEARRSGPPQKTVVTSKMLAETKIAALQVNPETTGGSDFLRRVAVRRDSAGGVVEIWNSSDNAQIFLRNGVIVGSRGVGRDIIAADAQVTVNALRSRTDRRGVRTFTVSDGDVTSTEMRFNCEIQNLGSNKITVVDQVFNVTHMRENCLGGPSGSNALRNDFWVQDSSGLVRKSRQWAGPAAGYFETVLLKN